jgi:MFS family permease
VLVLAVGAIASAFALNVWWLIGVRGVLGFGIGREDCGPRALQRMTVRPVRQDQP